MVPTSSLVWGEAKGNKQYVLLTERETSEETSERGENFIYSKSHMIGDSGLSGLSGLRL